MGTLDGNKIPKSKNQEVAVDNFNVNAYLKNKNTNNKKYRKRKKTSFTW
jgi:hypothetical protein